MRLGAVRRASSRLFRLLIRGMPWLLLAAGLSRIALALAFSQGPTGVRMGNDFVDLGVYRMGGRAILEGLPLYELEYEVGDLPFTYPPFGALAFVPLSAVSFGVAQVLMVLVSLASLILSAWLVASNLPTTLGSALPWSAGVSTAGLVGLGGMLEPTTTTLDLGQINLVLMAAILYDSVTRWRFAGSLVGVSAGIKIVPGIFALAMIPARRWVALRNACVAFAISVVIGGVFLPEQSWLFWSKLFYSDDRQPSVVWILNQSLYADFVRLMGEPTGVWVWIVAGGVVLVGGLRLATHVWTEDRLTSTITVAVTGLLVSPVSWNHHWVWLMPALATAGALGLRDWRADHRLRAGFAGLYVFLVTTVTAIGPIKLANATVGFDSTLSNWAVGNSLVASGVAYLVIVWATHPRGGRLASES